MRKPRDESIDVDLDAREQRQVSQVLLEDPAGLERLVELEVDIVAGRGIFLLAILLLIAQVTLEQHHEIPLHADGIAAGVGDAVGHHYRQLTREVVSAHVLPVASTDLRRFLDVHNDLGRELLSVATEPGRPRELIRRVRREHRGRRVRERREHGAELLGEWVRRGRRRGQRLAHPSLPTAWSI